MTSRWMVGPPNAQHAKSQCQQAAAVASSGAACLQSRLPRRSSHSVSQSSSCGARWQQQGAPECELQSVPTTSVSALCRCTHSPSELPHPFSVVAVADLVELCSPLVLATLLPATCQSPPRCTHLCLATQQTTQRLQRDLHSLRDAGPASLPSKFVLLSPSSSSPADSGRLIFATTLTLYARGVPYLFLFLLLPLVSYAIYATYEPSTTASASPTVDSYLSILPLTVVPLSFLLLVAAFVRFNRRLIATIHLMPDRRLALTTMNMLPSSASTPDYIIKQLDALIPPLAWTGSNDRTLHRLRFVREGEAGGVDQFWLYAAPSKAGQQGVELLRRIMTDNRLSSRELAL